MTDVTKLTDKELRSIVHGGGSPERGAYHPPELRQAARAELERRELAAVDLRR